jgi:hypothetical protein
MSWSWPSLTRERACVVTGVTAFVGGTSLQLMCMRSVFESYRQYRTVYTWLLSSRLYLALCLIFRSISYNDSLSGRAIVRCQV